MPTSKLTLKCFHTCGRLTFTSPFAGPLRCVYPEDITVQEYGAMTEGQYARVRAHFEQHAGRLHRTNPHHMINKWDLEHGALAPQPAPTFNPTHVWKAYLHGQTTEQTIRAA